MESLIQALIIAYALSWSQIQPNWDLPRAGRAVTLRALGPAGLAAFSWLSDEGVHKQFQTMSQVLQKLRNSASKASWALIASGPAVHFPVVCFWVKKETWGCGTMASHVLLGASADAFVKETDCAWPVWSWWKAKIGSTRNVRCHTQTCSMWHLPGQAKTGRMRQQLFVTTRLQSFCSCWPFAVGYLFCFVGFCGFFFYLKELKSTASMNKYNS